MLCRDSLGYDYPPQRLKARPEKLLKDENNKILIAQSGERTVGFLHLCTYEVLYAPKFMNIMGIAVSREFKRNGIGKALLNEGKKWAKKNAAV